MAELDATTSHVNDHSVARVIYRNSEISQLDLKNCPQ